jgi:hypothetical protein
MPAKFQIVTRNRGHIVEGAAGTTAEVVKLLVGRLRRLARRIARPDMRT